MRQEGMSERELRKLIESNRAKKTTPLAPP
jgi:hypothetical protein